MSDPALQSQLEAAHAYEALFVPALFKQWTLVVADAVEIHSGERVLDICCGTGILAREAVSRVEPTGSVVGLDLNPGMLAVAKEIMPAIEWRQGSAESLPFDDQTFDVVVSQFGLMFVADKAAALREIVRVLVPDGRMAIAVWDALDTMPAFAAEVALVERIAGRDVAEALRAPFSLGDRSALRALFDEAGVAAVDIKQQQGTAHFPSIRTMVEADLRGWLPVMGVNLPEDTIAQILQEAERELASYASDDGMMMFDVQAHIVTGDKG